MGSPTPGWAGSSRLTTVSRNRSSSISPMRWPPPSQFVELLEVLGFVLPFLVLVCLGAAYRLALDRRQAVFRVGFALTIAMAVHLLALTLGRSFYLDSVVPTFPSLLRRRSTTSS